MRKPVIEYISTDAVMISWTGYDDSTEITSRVLINANYCISYHCIENKRLSRSVSQNDGISLLVIETLHFECGGGQFDFSISSKHTRQGVEKGRLSGYDRSNTTMPGLVANDYIT